MKYALVNDEIREAQPGIAGLCKNCGNLTTAKCGKVKIWHWAHKGKRMCDPWWENETAWHRAWKDNFPKECQEVIHRAENGEKHIADVKTEHGYIVEFQHSVIKSEERQAREDFYKNMLWIIDGTRRFADKDKFITGLQDATQVNGRVVLYRLQKCFSTCALLRDWGENKTLVFFDFNEEILWGLYPEVKPEIAYLFRIERKALIAFLYPLNPIYNLVAIIKELGASIINYENQVIFQEKNRARQLAQRLQPTYRLYGHRRSRRL